MANFVGKRFMTEGGYSVFISGGNSKMGEVPNFNLTPGETCSAEACATCFLDGCYARKACENYAVTSAGVACRNNTQAVRYDLGGVEKVLREYFSNLNVPRIFRIHVSGDFDSVEYGKMWVGIARDFPNVHFLAFTKRWDVLREIANDVPANLQIVLSAWINIAPPDDLRKLFPVAWIDDEKCDDYSGGIMHDIDKSMFCHGGCDHCGMCWQLSHRHCDVTFLKH